MDAITDDERAAQRELHRPHGDGLLCHRDDVFVGFGAAGVFEPPAEHADDREWLAHHCWVCGRSDEEIEAENAATESDVAADEQDAVADVLAGDPGPEPAPDPEPPEPPQSIGSLPALQLVEQLAYRTLFAEAALTLLVAQLESQGIFPREFSDRLISEAEALVDAHTDRHYTEGRSGLLAAHLHSTLMS